MPYEIKLEMSWGTSTLDSDGVEDVRAKLESITDFGEQLSWYNAHVKSLALHGLEGRIYFGYGDTKLYCSCEKCLSRGDFNPEHQKIFIQQRTEEVNRIINGLKPIESYADRLDYLLKVPGFNFSCLILWAMFEDSENPTTNDEEAEPEVDLNPKNKEEIEIYNYKIYAAFLDEYKPDGQFSSSYTNFDFSKEKERLTQTIRKAVHPEDIINDLIQRIEQATTYRQPKGEKIGRSNNTISDSFQNYQYASDVFISLAEGEDFKINLRKGKLTEGNFLRLEHGQQMFYFYKWLLELSEKGLDHLRKELPEVPFIGQLFNHNQNIPSLIRSSYRRLIPQPTDRSQVHPSYIGPLEEAFQPFGRRICGAYPLYPDWQFLEVKRADLTSPFGKATKREFEEALQDYGRSFIEGYYAFDKEKVESGLFDDGALRVQRVFDYATGRPFNDIGFPESYGEGVGLFDGWGRSGRRAGMFYRAWYLIIENYPTFLPLFEAQELARQGEVRKVAPAQTEAEKLTVALEEYGFAELPKIASLKAESRKKLILKMATSAVPYQMAMLDFVGFIDHLSKNHFTTKEVLHKKLGNILATDARTVKGNRLVLDEYSRENRERYTAHLHKEEVVHDYESLVR